MFEFGLIQRAPKIDGLNGPEIKHSISKIDSNRSVSIERVEDVSISSVHIYGYLARRATDEDGVRGEGIQRS